MRIKNAGPSEVARLDRQLATWFWLFSRRLFGFTGSHGWSPVSNCWVFSIDCFGRPEWWLRDSLATAPHQDSAKPNVQCDASWFLQNPSKDIIERVAKDRETHIENVMATRANGVVSISLSEAISGNVETRDQRQNSSSSSPVVESLPCVEDQAKASSNRSSSGGLMIEIKGGAKYAR